MDWIIRLKRPIRSKSVYVLCYGKNRETAIAPRLPYALRKPSDVSVGITMPVLINAPDERVALEMAVSFINRRTCYGQYDPRVTRA